ncbi:MAG: DUF2505 domain-containing protein [Actinobacteria bacterium]|nr:DUF2505 domain-containing protein [Actinomycetota bacterium]
MATSLSVRLDLPAGPETAGALLTDPDYVQAVGEGTGGQDVEVSVTPSPDGGVVVESRRALPAQVPSYARALVGDTLRLVETRTFGPAAPDGSRDGSASVRFEGAPVSITGPMRLEAGGAGTVLSLELSVSASVPFVGGKVERFAAEQIERAAAKEEQIAAGRLA